MHTVHSGKSLRGDEASLLRLSRKGEEKSVIARILSIRLDSHI